jgi:hypothetical protein
MFTRVFTILPGESFKVLKSGQPIAGFKTLEEADQFRTICEWASVRGLWDPEDWWRVEASTGGLAGLVRAEEMYFSRM